MREIELKSVGWGKRRIHCEIVDEESLKFKNGVALAQANLMMQDKITGDYSTYQCFGLIDENFCEVYNGVTREERNLMFFPHNKDAFRFGDKDFLIKLLCGSGSLTWEEYRHIQIVDGVPIIIKNNLGNPKRTSHDNLVIMEMEEKSILYDIDKENFITPYLHFIDESGSIFNAIAKITLDDEENRFELVDYLAFKIDSMGNRISGVISSLENGYLNVDVDVSIEEIIAGRKEQLKIRNAQFTQVLSAFQTEPVELGEQQRSNTIKMVKP